MPKVGSGSPSAAYTGRATIIKKTKTQAGNLFMFEYALLRTQVCHFPRLEEDFGGEHHLPRDSAVTSQNAGDGIACELGRGEDVATGCQSWNQLPVGMIEQIVSFGTKLQAHLFAQTNVPGQGDVLKIRTRAAIEIARQ